MVSTTLWHAILLDLRKEDRQLTATHVISDKHQTTYCPPLMFENAEDLQSGGLSVRLSWGEAEGVN